MSASADADRRAHPSPHAELRALSTRTVLVVDDEASIRELLAVILEVEGHRVLTAASAADALVVLAQEEVDLITLDVMMPEVDGWQLADELDGDVRTAAIPRVMISGKPMEELRSAPGARRAAAVLTKPFDFTQVSGLVHALLAAPARTGIPRPRAS